MKKILHFKTVLLSLLCFLFLIIGQAQTLESKIDKLLQAEFKANEPGVSALVYKNGKVIYRKAFGNANMELNIPMTPENVFEIGSITKQFTAVSILMLMEQGKLNLEDEITKYIPDYPTHGKTITIHHLLTHTSGIKSYTDMKGFGEIVRNDMSPIELINFFKNEPIDFDPGEEYKYNNSGFFILGHIIEVVSEQSYADFIEKNIFEKIYMTSSHYGSQTKLIKNRATGYQDDAQYGFANANYISLTLPYAAGSIMSNVDDMLKWQKAVTNNTFVKAETIKKAFTNYKLNNGKNINYGYGWSLNDINGTASIEHGGGIPGYLSYAVSIPSEDTYVIVFSNCGCNSPTSITTKIAAVAIGKEFPEVEKAVILSEEQLNKWVGAYQFEDDAIRFITLKDGQLYSQREDSTPFKILPLSENEYFFEDGLISYTFSKNNEKREALFKNRMNISKGIETDKEIPAEKVEISLTAEFLKQYIGKYELQPSFSIEVTTNENQIFAQATGQPQFELFAESATTFFLKVVKASVEFKLNEKGVVTGLVLNQGGQQIPGKKVE